MSARAEHISPDRQGRAILTSAIVRSRRASLDGVLERLFALAFNGLVYPQIWEDPEVDMQAMELRPGHHVVAIASGGCNVLSYLTAAPLRITAVDLNRAHVALTRLKLTGLRHLPDWPTYYRFFGEARHPRNLRDFNRYLRPHLDSETRNYWDGRGWTGRRRYRHFAGNLYRRGLLGRFIGASHGIARLYGKDMSGLLESRSTDEQRRFFEEEIAPLFDRRLVRWLTARRLSLYGLGIPPAQYAALAGGRPMSAVLRQRLERLACGFPIDQNYFAWQAFGRAYAPAAGGPLPPYLQEQHFENLRDRVSGVTVNRTSFTDALLAMPSASVDRYVLLDAQDWMNDAQLAALWSEITRTAVPGARVIFRTAGETTILPGRVPADTLSRWCYHEDLSRQLASRDRSSIYGGFHLYERRTAQP
jgi:S-adenosylmethionine-diacylglycerol 3-amino-3-carboxypropyl transferase